MHADSIPSSCAVFFFHLQSQPLETVLPKLLLKTLKQDWRASICLPHQTRLSQLSEALWNVPNEWILPHGFGDAPYPDKQPIWLDTSLSRPNKAEVVFLCDGAWQQEIVIDEDIQRLCLMIEPSDRTATQNARSLWPHIAADRRTVVKI